MKDKYKSGFEKTKKSFSERFKEVFTGSIDDELYDNLIETLVLGDVSYKTAEEIINSAVSEMKRSDMKDYESALSAVRKSSLDLLEKSNNTAKIEKPCIILVMGVNGVGKTTTIAKLANMYKNNGDKVMLAAADTFRAAASEQLSVWAERIGVPIVKSTEGQDAAGILYDASASAKAKNTDILLCDTAGRLQNKKNLMDELAKMWRVCEKQADNFNIYSLIVLDAMTGQNSLVQLKEFSEIRKPDGIVLTKTDGAAKGGIILSIASSYNVPVWYVGVGEGMDDIVEFDPEQFVKAIL